MMRVKKLSLDDLSTSLMRKVSQSVDDLVLCAQLSSLMYAISFYVCRVQEFTDV